MSTIPIQPELLKHIVYESMESGIFYVTEFNHIEEYRSAWKHGREWPDGGFVVVNLDNGRQVNARLIIISTEEDCQQIAEIRNEERQQIKCENESQNGDGQLLETVRQLRKEIQDQRLEVDDLKNRVRELEGEVKFLKEIHLAKQNPEHMIELGDGIRGPAKVFETAIQRGLSGHSLMYLMDNVLPEFPHEGKTWGQMTKEYTNFTSRMERLMDYFIEIFYKNQNIDLSAAESNKEFQNLKKKAINVLNNNNAKYRLQLTLNKRKSNSELPEDLQEGTSSRSQESGSDGSGSKRNDNTNKKAKTGSDNNDNDKPGHSGNPSNSSYGRHQNLFPKR